MKKSLSILGISMCAIPLLAVQTVHAEDGPLNADKTAQVQLTGGGTVTPPETNPYPPVGPNQPVTTFGISSASNLYFDPISLTAGKTTKDALYYSIDTQGTETPISNVANDGTLPDVPTTADGSGKPQAYTPGYSVTDLRGTGSGWTLSLQLGEFKDNPANSTHTIKGATLSFPSVNAITSDDVTYNSSLAPVAFAQTFAAGGASANLMSADTGKGMGYWEARYNSRELTYSDNSKSVVAPIQLTVPGDNYAGNYTADLTWTLADGGQQTPAN